MIVGNGGHLLSPHRLLIERDHNVITTSPVKLAEPIPNIMCMCMSNSAEGIFNVKGQILFDSTDAV